MKCFIFTLIVEKNRKNLIEATKRHGLASHEAIEASQFLDKVLNLLNHQLLDNGD